MFATARGLFLASLVMLTSAACSSDSGTSVAGRDYRVSGRITLAATGGPAAGVSVILRRNSAGAPALDSARTDGDGQFNLAGPRPDEYEVVPTATAPLPVHAIPRTAIVRLDEQTKTGRADFRLTTVDALVSMLADTVSEAVHYLALRTAVATRELFPSSSTPITESQGAGVFTTAESSGLWNRVLGATNLAQDIISRFSESTAVPAEARVWAGFAYRLMAENFCEAVLGGGPRQPSAQALREAETQFTYAVLTAPAGSDLRTAAFGGRASVRVALRDFAGARADASQVGANFAFRARASTSPLEHTNPFVRFTSSSPSRAVTAWNTPYDDYYTTTGDPRTSWRLDPVLPFGDSSRPPVGNVPWKAQTKYTRLDEGIPLTTSGEMRLVDAEYALMTGGGVGGLTPINNLRTSVQSATGKPLQPWIANNLEEVFVVFKRERGIQLWLEGRRLGDLRRWKDQNIPGTLQPLEDSGNPVTYLSTGQTLCIPVS